METGADDWVIHLLEMEKLEREQEERGGVRGVVVICPNCGWDGVMLLKGEKMEDFKPGECECGTLLVLDTRFNKGGNEE